MVRRVRAGEVFLAWSTFVLQNADMPLPNTDDIHLDRLRDHFARHRSLPSYAGLGEVVGFQAKTAAVKLAQRLTTAGFLRRAPGGKLAPSERFFELPLVEAPVRAGEPTEVEGQVAADSVSLASYLVDEPSRTVLLRVKGDSMRDAGIFAGDLAVVERADTARPGEYVVAMVEGGFTVKELRYEGRKPMLVPHNPQYKPIVAKGEVKIFGVVRGIVRRYQGAAKKRQPHSGGKP